MLGASERQGVELLKAKQAKAVFTWTRNLLLKSLAGWHCSTAMKRCRTRMVCRIAVHIATSSLCSALAQWHTSARGLIRMRTLSARAMQRWAWQTSARSIDTWHDEARRISHRRQAMARILLGVTRRAGSSAMDAWKTHVLLRKSLKARSRSIAYGLRHGELRARWEMWHAWAWGRRRARSTVTMIGRRMMGRRLDASFESWRLQARDARNCNRIADGCAIRHKRLVMTLSIDTWQVYTQLPRSRPLVQRTLIVMKTLEQNNAFCLRCIDAWRTRTIEKRILRAMSARATNRVVRAVLCRSLESWRSVWCSFYRMQQRGRKIVRTKLQQHTHLTAWSILLHWRAISHQRRQRRARILSRLASVLRVNRTVANDSQVSGIVAQFELLSSSQGQMAGSSASAAIQFRDKKQKSSWRRSHIASNAQMYVGITLIVQTHCRSRVLKAWSNVFATAVRDRAVSSKCCLRRNWLTLEQTWSSWLNLAQKHRMVSVLRGRVTRRGRHCSLSWAWEYLCYNHSSISHKKQVNIGLERRKEISVRRLMSFVLARCYNAWYEHYVVAKRQRCVSLRVRHRLASRLRAQAVAAWHGSLVVTRRVNQAAARLRMHSDSVLSGSFHTWQCCAKLELRMNVFRNRLVSLLLLNSMASAFDVWQIHARKQQHMREVCIKIIAHMINRGLAPAFDAWRHSAEARKKIIFTVLCILKQWQADRRAISFETWYDHAHQQARGRQVLARTVGKWCMRNVAGTFVRWRASATAQARGREISLRAMRRLLLRCSGAAFQGWCEHLREVQTIRIGQVHESHRERVCTLEVHRRRRKRLQTCLVEWAGVTQNRAWHQRISSVYSSKLVKTHVQLRIAYWWGEASCKRRARLLYARAVRCFRRRFSKSVLRRWKLFVGLRVLDRLKNVAKTISMRRLVTTLLHQIWDTWSAQARSSRLWSKMACRTSHRTLLQICSSWLDMVKEANGLRSRADKVVSRAEKAVFARSLSKWWCDVVLHRKKHKAARMRRAQLLSAVLRSWRTTLAEGKRSRALAARAMSRINSATALMWRAWTEWVFHVLSMRAAKDRTGLSLVLSHTSTASSSRPNRSLGGTDMLDEANPDPRQRGIC